MEGQSRSSHRYLLLQVWCALLTVSMVVMAVFVASIKPKSDEVSTLKPANVSPTAQVLDGNFSMNDQSWEESLACDSCSLVLQDNSIYFKKQGLYFIYAQVTFREMNESNFMVLKRNAVFGKSMITLAEGTCPPEKVSVLVARIVRLTEGDSVSLNISGVILKESTVWGAFHC
uniref:THD domain-containing protein n=1 Tax=Acanthochromis polyacanthus TaxID=80966 RepID=A0A3Q1ERU4_9TELE